MVPFFFVLQMPQTLSDEELARQLQRQLDLEAAHERQQQVSAAVQTAVGWTAATLSRLQAPAASDCPGCPLPALPKRGCPGVLSLQGGGDLAASLQAMFTYERPADEGGYGGRGGRGRGRGRGGRGRGRGRY